MAVRCEFHVANDAGRKAAIDKTRLAMTPATDKQLSEWLSLLQAATAHRADSESATAAGYAVYLGALRRFPADVAKAACERLARGNPRAGTNWFPTLAELVDECEILASPRQVMLAALEHWKPAQPVSKRGHPTKAERERALEMAKDFGAFIDAEKAKRPKAPDLPPIQAKVDETGVSDELRAVLARQADCRI